MGEVLTSQGLENKSLMTYKYIVSSVDSKNMLLPRKYYWSKMRIAKLFRYILLLKNVGLGCSKRCC